MRRSIVGVVCMAALIAAADSGTLLGQRDAGKVEFTAFAIDPNATGSAATRTVQIVIDRWSTDSEHGQFMAALQERSPERQRNAVQKLRRIGYIRTPDTIGYELHYARQVTDGDGGRRVFIATDRPIGFWEARNRPRTIDYPFTFIEMHLGHGDAGEGKMSVATRVSVDKSRNLIELENYSAQPVMLRNVTERTR